MNKFCPRCERYRGTRIREREETYEIRHSKITVPVKVEVCDRCGAEIGEDEKDEQIVDAARHKYREENGLLAPGQIKAVREAYNLSQKSFAALLGMSEATINRYENGALQDEAHDALIRACQHPDFVQERLQKNGHRLSEWQRERVEQAIGGMSSMDRISSCGDGGRSAERIMSFAGNWDKMPEEDFSAFLRETRRRREDSFGSRRRP